MTSSAEWDKRYSGQEYIYGIQPNEFLRGRLKGLTPGKLLLPGEGEGRNALWAAKNGWEVDAFDYSNRAKEKAMAIFKEHNLIVNYQVAAFSNFKTTKKYNAVGVIFMHVPKAQQKQFAETIVNLMATEAMLVLEVFHPNQISRTSGGPKNPDLFFTTDELANYFSKLRISHLAVEEVELNEGKLHQGEALVIRMVAHKKG